MKRRFAFALSLTTAFSLAAHTGLLAQGPQIGIGDPSGQGVLLNYKTPPLADSDTITVPIEVHAAATTLNWAGVRMNMHVLDANEVDVDKIIFTGVPVPGPAMTLTDPFGPRSMNVQSTPLWFTVFDPFWETSGITLQPSINVPAFNITLHAKNTTPLNNSDVDIAMQFWNIYHVPGGPGSTLIPLPQSAYIWGTINFNPVTQSEFPTFPIELGQGTWWHVTDPAGKTMHVTEGVGSALYATLAGTATIGIEHIPEPAAPLLAVLGGSAVLFGLRARNKRRRAAA